LALLKRFGPVSRAGGGFAGDTVLKLGFAQRNIAIILKLPMAGPCPAICIFIAVSPEKLHLSEKSPRFSL
jgi:hypothetical protein